MFYKLFYRRSLKSYKRSYIGLFVLFLSSLVMISFLSVYSSSMAYYDEAVLKPMLTADWTCDIRVTGITETEAEYFSDIDNIDAYYIDGSLDIDVVDKSRFDATWNEVNTRFNEVFPYDYTMENDIGITYYYGRTYEPSPNTGFDLLTLILQVLLSSAAIISMTLFYLEYLRQRRDDIRILLTLGISDKQLGRLFFGEFNFVYLPAALLGIPLGAGAVFAVSKIIEGIDMTTTTFIYPVFHVDIATLVYIILLSYAILYISYRIVLAVFSRTGSLSRQDDIRFFNPDKVRLYYFKASERFDRFFCGILRKRKSFNLRVAGIMTSVMSALLIILLINLGMMSNVGPEILVDTSNPGDVAAYLANRFYEFMVLLWGTAYLLIIISLLTKRHIESHLYNAEILYSLGATHEQLYYCTRRDVLATAVGSLVGGLAAAVLILFAASLNMYSKISITPLMLILLILYFILIIGTYMLTVRRQLAGGDKSKSVDCNGVTENESEAGGYNGVT